MRKIIVIDRDGTIVKEPKGFQVDSFEKLDLVNDVVPSLLYLKSLGFEFILASNQDNLGSELFPLKSFEGPQNLLIRFLISN